MAVVNGTISATADDCQIYWTGSAWTKYDGTVLWYGKGNDKLNFGILRFTLDAAIPLGSVVTSAYLSMYGSSSVSVTEAWLHVQDSADAPATVDAADRPSWVESGDITTYPTTQEGAGAGHWTGTWVTASWNSIEIASLLQHLVDEFGLASGAHVVVFISGDTTEGTSDENGWEGYESANKATLIISYTTAGQQPGGGAADNRFRFRPSQRV